MLILTLESERGINCKKPVVKLHCPTVEQVLIPRKRLAIYLAPRGLLLLLRQPRLEPLAVGPGRSCSKYQMMDFNPRIEGLECGE